MNFNQYINSLIRIWDAGSGKDIARFVSLRDNHITYQDLYKEYPERYIDRSIQQPFDEVVTCHIRVLFYLSRSTPNYTEAFKCQQQAVAAVVKLLNSAKEENWPLPIMYTVCLDLRLLAVKCELNEPASKPGEILEKAAESLMSCFRICAADSRSSDEDTKRHGMLNLVNQLLKVYFKINKLHLCKPLIRAIESSPLKDLFPLPEQITYKYFVGRKAMFDSDYKASDEFLSYAFQKCPDRCKKNKRLILIYLIPVKMLLGIMPRREVLEKYDLMEFLDIIAALKQGNVRKLDQMIEQHERFFIESGIYLIVEKLKIIAYRNLFKRVWSIVKTHQIDLNHFMTALHFVGEDDITMEETHCIVANLIYENKIKGYISHQHNKLVVSKQNPFPPLHTVT